MEQTSVQTPAQLSWQSSARRRRLKAMRPLMSPVLHTALMMVSGMLWLAAVIGYLLGYKLAILLIVPGAPLAMLGFYSSWGLDQFGSDWLAKRNTGNIPDILSPELTIRLSRRSDLQAIWRTAQASWQANYVLSHLELSDQTLQAAAVVIGKLTVDQLYSLSGSLMQQVGSQFINGGTILVAGLLEVEREQPGWLGTFEISEQDLIFGLNWLEHIERDRLERRARESFGGIGRDFAAGYTNYLDQFATNLSDEIEAGHRSFSAYGREELLDQFVQLLNQPARTNVALIGATGSGKTTLVYRFAEKILTGMPAGKLTYRKMMSVSATAITSAGKNESVEAIFTKMMNDAVRAKNVILYFEDASLFFENKPGAIDATRILQPIVEKTHLPMIFGFTDEEWTRFAQINGQLVGMLNKLQLPEVTDELCFQILQDVAFDFENQHQLVITYRALKQAIQLSNRFLGEKAQPGRSIDLLMSSLNYAVDGRVTEQSVNLAVESRTGVKTGVVEQGSSEAQTLLKLEDLIHERMINQNTAVKAVSSALRRARTGVRDPKRPVGSFLFLGPTGVGKTELARSLAAVYFSDEQNMIRLDMSEYQSPSDINRLLGAAAETSAGSAFLEQVRMKPASVVLLDEIEKAHPDFLNLLLQMLDEGRLTDTAGKAVSFKEAIIIATSNAGAEQIRQWVSDGVDLETKHDALIDLIIGQKLFKPELLNRFDDITMFRPLKPEELQQVVAIQLQSLNKQLASRHIMVVMAPEALAFMVDKGNDPRMGARPMRRALQRFVEDVIAQRMLAGQIKSGETITITRQDLEAVEAQS